MLLFFGMSVFVIGMNAAEELYPGYSASMNYISDLGATCRASGCQIFQPSAAIFNSSVLLAGLFTTIAAYLLRNEFGKKIFPSFIAISGIGSMGVGLFPEYQWTLHYLSASLAFVFGGLSAVVACRILEPPLCYLSLLTGAFSITALILFATGHFLGLGPGGMERMIVYPFVIWALCCSGWLMHSDGSCRGQKEA